MRFNYKKCEYRTENLTEKQKVLMSKEIQKAEMKAERLALTVSTWADNINAEKLKNKPDEKEKPKSYKRIEKEDKQ